MFDIIAFFLKIVSLPFKPIQEVIRRIFKSWRRVVVGILLLLVGVEAIFCFLYVDDRLKEKTDLPDGVIADFVPRFPESKFRDFARNNRGFEWKHITDNKIGGTSVISYKLDIDPERPEKDFLRIEFKTGEANSERRQPYCGVYTDFSAPPYKVIDVSEYKRIQIRARYRPAEGVPSDAKPPTFFIQLASLGIPDYEYHEIEFTPGVAFPKPKDTPTYAFSDFQTPWWSKDNRKHLLDLKRIFRVGIVIKSDEGEVSGHLDLDDIRFVK